MNAIRNIQLTQLQLVQIPYDQFDTFSKLVYDDENVSTYKILGSLEILAIKKTRAMHVFSTKTNLMNK